MRPPQRTIKVRRASNYSVSDFTYPTLFNPHNSPVRRYFKKGKEDSERPSYWLTQQSQNWNVGLSASIKPFHKKRCLRY